MKNLVNYAVKYAEKGMYVLPMFNKKPLIKFADQPALTTNEIRKLWKKFPYAQVALRTVDFFVVDIDEHEGGADGFKSFNEFKEKHPDYFIETLKQKTAGGGEQLFFLKRQDMNIQQNIGWLPGVDIKANNNNYVVVAPSENKGKCYQWLNHHPIATAPKELVTSINKRKRLASNFKLGNYDFNNQSTRTAELFEQVVDGLGFTGGRNNALASFVGALLYRNVTPKKAYQLALIANGNTYDPLPDNEVDTTFNSMVKKEIRRREVGDGN